MSEPGGSGRASRRLRDDSSMSFAGIRRENYGSLQRDASRGDGTAHGTGDANRGLDFTNTSSTEYEHTQCTIEN